jgi:catechol 2,3-dioxygenase-like lactoylglutathione lyase family enzyme
MSTLRVTLVSLPVADQDRARDFYRDKLGFTVIVDKPLAPGHKWLQVSGPGGGAEIALVKWFDTMPPGSTQGLVVECDDPDAEHARLVAAEVDIDDINDGPTGRYANLRDSEGNGLILRTPHSV